MLLGLTGNRDALSQAAARSTTTVEELDPVRSGVIVIEHVRFALPQVRSRCDD